MDLTGFIYKKIYIECILFKMSNAANSSFKQSLKLSISKCKTIYIYKSIKNQKDNLCQIDFFSHLKKNSQSNGGHPKYILF